MPIRQVKQQSDRGSIKDIQNGDDEKCPPTPYELRIKGLYEHALMTRDQVLLDSLGLVAINGAPKDPISIFRHREYVTFLSNKLADKIKKTTEELAGCFSSDYSNAPQEMKWSRYKQQRATEIILADQDMMKVADADGNSYTRVLRSFRRVS